MISQCTSIFNSHGIIHQHSCPYSPQKNGRVEIKHKHLFQLSQALMFQSGLPSHFWGYFILHATYIINRLPTVVLDLKTPYECLFKTKPNLKLLRTFGCLCFVSNLQPTKTKFNTRSFKCVFLGIAPNQKGYILYNLDLDTTVISKDVIFHESHFLFLPDPPAPPDPTLVISKSQSLSVEQYNDSIVPKSSRSRNPPPWLSNYVCTSSPGSSLDIMGQSVQELEPHSYNQASKSKE